MKRQPFFSVILATKNEENNIARCLDSLLKQTYPREYFEIILVDNNSTDNTRTIARTKIKYVYNLPIISPIKSVKNFRGAQVNWAMKKSRGEAIFFPDADMTFDKNLLKEAAKLIEEKDFDALYIPEKIVRKGWFGKIRNFERSFYNQTCIDAIRIVRKRVFENVGGFDEKRIYFGPDDWDLNKRIKNITNSITITHNKLFHHEEDLTLHNYLIKKSIYTKTFDSYIHKWGKDDSDIKKQFGFYYRYIGVFIENGKWKIIVSNPILAIGMISLRFAVGIVYLYKKLSK